MPTKSAPSVSLCRVYRCGQLNVCFYLCEGGWAAMHEISTKTRSWAFAKHNYLPIVIVDWHPIQKLDRRTDEVDLRAHEISTHDRDTDDASLALVFQDELTVWKTVLKLISRWHTTEHSVFVVFCSEFDETDDKTPLLLMMMNMNYPFF